MSRPVVLLTDFGSADPFVGLMKCVIETRCPGATIIDLCHEVPPQSVVAGAFWLTRSVRFLPPDAVCVAVVDPGVGTARRAIVVEHGGRVYVGPDNGLLAGLSEEDGAAWVIEPDRLGITVESATFHGRDLFAPVGAEIAARRCPPSSVGPRAGDLVASPLQAAARRDDRVDGAVVVVDRFGNLISNIEASAVVGSRERAVEIAGRRLAIVETYGEVANGALCALVSSFGTVEVARRGGSAAGHLALGPGAPVHLLL